MSDSREREIPIASATIISFGRIKLRAHVELSQLKAFITLYHSENASLELSFVCSQEDESDENDKFRVYLINYYNPDDDNSKELVEQEVKVWFSMSESEVLKINSNSEFIRAEIKPNMKTYQRLADELRKVDENNELDKVLGTPN